VRLTDSRQQIGALFAVLFFVFWTLVLLAGADKPPPLGFVWIVLAVAVCAVVVYWRIPTYIDWQCTKRSGRFWRVILDGLVAGLLVALPFALAGGDEPSVTPQASDYVIWFFVVGLMGVVNSVVLYSASAVARAVSGRGSTG
jgi:hypothetical protein